MLNVSNYFFVAPSSGPGKRWLPNIRHSLTFAIIDRGGWRHRKGVDRKLVVGRSLSDWGKKRCETHNWSLTWPFISSSGKSGAQFCRSRFQVARSGNTIYASNQSFCHTRINIIDREFLRKLFNWTLSRNGRVMCGISTNKRTQINSRFKNYWLYNIPKYNITKVVQTKMIGK